MLDAALAKVGAFRQSRNDPKLWMMGLQMKQIVDGLQTKIQIPLTSTVLNDGQIVMANYANSPIFETDYLVPEEASTSPDDLAGVAAAGGNLNASVSYRIASVTAFGEQAASAATDAIDATGSKKVTLSWTADPNAKLYHIFRKDGTGAWKLLDIVAALTYDAAGAINGSVEEYVDLGSKTPVAVKPREAGEEQILLLNRNQERGICFLGKVDDMGRQTGRLMSFVELARFKDSCDWMVKCYLGVRVKYPNTCGAIIRNVKRA